MFAELVGNFQYIRLRVKLVVIGQNAVLALFSVLKAESLEWGIAEKSERQGHD